MEQRTAIAATAGRVRRWTEVLATEIGPRRPASRAERTAAQWLREQLAEAGLEARLEPFPAYSSFAAPQAIPLLLGLAAMPAARLRPRSGAAVGALALALAAAEEDFRLRPLSRALARGRSQNVVGVVEPRGSPRRTLCLVSHIDSSRSGWLFHPAIATRIRSLLALTTTAFGTQALGPILGRTRGGRAAVGAGRAWLAAMLGLLAERELRGEDVPGANDNASGAALTAALAAEVAEAPLASTRLVLLVTGAEEAGTLGSDAFVRSRDTAGWLFLNFDGVAAPATLRYLPREGLMRTFAADAGLVDLVAGVASRRPELGVKPAQRLVGLTYDATPILARGGRALTISAQDASIPHYHQPSDGAGNVDAGVLARALELGRELIAAVDRGEAG